MFMIQLLMRDHEEIPGSELLYGRDDSEIKGNIKT